MAAIVNALRRAPEKEFIRKADKKDVLKNETVRIERSNTNSPNKNVIEKKESNGSEGFRLWATKIKICIQLLTGELPDRSIFKDSRLKAYYEVTANVRKGDMTH